MTTGWIKDQVVLITGGGSGIGLAIAERFVDEGAKLILVGHEKRELELAAQTLGKTVATYAGDVRNYSTHAGAVALAEERFGRLDCLIANAGIWDFMTSLADMPEGEALEVAIDDVLSVNVKGYLMAAKAALPALSRSGGNIIFTLSNAAFHVAGGGPLYTASKHAGVGLVKQLASELAPRIRVNAVAPGVFKSNLKGPSGFGLEKTSIADVPLEDIIADVVPMGTIPHAKDYTAPYLLLASPHQVPTATGSIISIDGGMGVRGFPRPGGGYDLEARYTATQNGSGDQK